MVTIITGTTNKPVSSDSLKEFFETHDYEGYLYIGYPIIGTNIGAFPIDALFVSKEKGLIIFNLVEGKSLGNYQDEQDDSANKMESKLRSYKELLSKRKLLVDINIITFAPIINNLEYNEEYPLCNQKNLKEAIDLINWNNSDAYESLVSVLQSISNIRKGRKKREVKNENSRGFKLKQLEDSIANLDNQQSRAVIETVNGVQRIRGLAGSGKTIVLALKAAYLHAHHPEWKIAVTFHTRALKGQFKHLINSFYIEQTNEEPDWDNLQIIHAWGAPGGLDKNGLYYTFCKMNNVEYLDFGIAKSKYSSGKEFEGACKEALNNSIYINQYYDVILVDEAQDFPPDFLRLCYEMLKEPKRLVYAYDELQNLNGHSLPSPEIIFGNNSDETPKVIFSYSDVQNSQQDIILEKCYRNSRPALVTAHALGFGVYREKNPKIGTGLVQMFEQNNLWNDIGYKVVNGKLDDGELVQLERTSESSPRFLENHSPIEDLIIFKSFTSKEEQNLWVANEITKNIYEDELRADDIMVINPDPLTTRKNVSHIRALLFDKNIQSHTAGVDTSPDIFFDSGSDSIAFTGIYRAKGNEAAMVYIINAQDCFYSHQEMAKIRNRLFTAITRSKAWVRVVGVGNAMDKLIEEYEKVKENKFTLKFQYPTKEQRQHLNIVNRDMSEIDRQRIKKGQNTIDELIEDLESGRIYVEDLGVEQVTRLKSLLIPNNDEEN